MGFYKSALCHRTYHKEREGASEAKLVTDFASARSTDFNSIQPSSFFCHHSFHFFSLQHVLTSWMDYRMGLPRMDRGGSRIQTVWSDSGLVAQSVNHQQGNATWLENRSKTTTKRWKITKKVTKHMQNYCKKRFKKRQNDDRGVKQLQIDTKQLQGDTIWRHWDIRQLQGDTTWQKRHNMTTKTHKLTT